MIYFLLNINGKMIVGLCLIILKRLFLTFSKKLNILFFYLIKNK